MTIDKAVDLTRDAIYLALMIGGPILLVSIIISLIVSLAQALTSIQDQTLSVVPRLIVAVLAFLITLPWILQRMTEYSAGLIRDIPGTF